MNGEVTTIPTFTGDVSGVELGTTLIHEHVFVVHPELDVNMPHPEWDEDAAIDAAVAGFERLRALGVDTVVDLTVLGHGRDVRRVAHVAERTSINLIAATGYYTADVLPHFFRTHGPDGFVGGPDPLTEVFLRDIRSGIGGTRIRAAMLKVATDSDGFTPDLEKVWRAAATAHRETGVPITTHTHAPTRGGLDQQRMLRSLGVELDRVVIGHAGDSEDLDYLRRLAGEGSYLGFDRFGMEHMASDEQRVRTLLTLLEEGLAPQIVLSHDAAFFSRMTPPSWRARAVPHWHMENLHRRILPRLRGEGVSEDLIHTMMVDNPRRILTGAPA